MGLSSLLLSLLGVLTFFVLFSGGLGILVSGFFAILGIVFGIIGIKRKEGTATAGLVISIIVFLADVFLIMVLVSTGTKIF